MSEIKLSLLDKRIERFCDSSRDLLTDIHAKHKGGSKGTLNRERRMQKTISIPNPDIDLLDEEPFDL